MTTTTVNSKTRFAAKAIAAAFAITIAVTAIVPEAQAGRKGRFLGGVAVGVLGTAIVANEIRRNREARHYRESRWERHVRRCYRAYRSYDERSDTFIDFRGRERRCRK